MNKRRESGGESPSRPHSSEQQDEDGRDVRSASNIQRPFMSSATIGEVDAEVDDESEHEQPHQSDFEGTSDASVPSLDEDSQSNSPSEHDDFKVIVGGPDVNDREEQFQSPSTHSSQQYGYPDFQGLPEATINDLEYMDQSEVQTAWFYPLPQAPNDYFGSGAAPLSLLNASTPMAVSQQFPCEPALKVEQLESPVSMSLTPPKKDISSRFALKSPRPINIAARRNLQRPAPLGISVSRQGSYYQGPKTGIEMSRRRAEDTTPMRRTASATGLRRLPRVSEGFRSPSLNLQAMRSPSYNRSASPVSPSRAETTATHNSEEQQGLSYSSFDAPLSTRFGETSVNTPPVTPGLPISYNSFANPFEQAWAHGATDQPLATPSLCSHGGSEMDFPGTSHIPTYIASQPATPGFPRPDAFGPGFRFVHGGMSNAPEYTFPDSGYVESSLASLPHEQQASKTFQFAQNVTPQDYGTE